MISVDSIVYKNGCACAVNKRKSSKMKLFLVTVMSLVLSAGAQPEAPYAPSGWRPSGPNFELPQSAPAQNPQQFLPPIEPRNRTPQKQEYLPPTEPSRDYGTPEEDVSVQGLPTQEQLPIFQLSPVNGQQYVGPNFNSDLRNLDQSYRQSQFQTQQDVYRQFTRQRQQEAQASNRDNEPNQQIPRQFVSRTTISPTRSSIPQRPEFKTTQVDSTTESLNLNEGEVLNDQYKPASSKQNQEKVSVEVTKQNLQEISPELLLNTLAQLRLQPQLVPIQFGQLKAPVNYQPIQQQVNQKQVVAGYDGAAHFAALPSVIAQQQLLQSQPQLIQPLPQTIQGQPQLNQAPPQFISNQQGFVENPAFTVQRGQAQNPGFIVPAEQPFNQYQPSLNNQYEVVQPQVQTFPQLQAQPIIFQNQQSNQPQPSYGQAKTETNEQDYQPQPQFVYQQSYQPEAYQQPQPFPVQPLNQYQPQQQNLIYPAQMVIQNQDYYQNQRQTQVSRPTFQDRRQDGSLQSGLDVNQQGNGIDQTEDKDDGDNEDEGVTATAVATAFGARTQPRVYTQYGTPQANSQYQTTTEPMTQDGEAKERESVTEEAATARGSRRKSAKLRNRRVRPVFTVDRSGHLVLAQDQ